MYWISFVDEQDHFAGAVIVESAGGFGGALEEAIRRGLNPGGQALVMEIPARHRDQARPYRHRLMQRDELLRVFGPLAGGQELRERAGDHAQVICAKCNRQ